MIDQDLIDRCEGRLEECDKYQLSKAYGFISSLNTDMVELLENYKKLVESEDTLRKELARLRDEKVSLELDKLLISEDDWPE